jgi:neutral ceramidase
LNPGMKFRIDFLLIAFVAFLSHISANANEPLLKGSVAVRDITAPIGYRLCGYFYERFSTGVHDPLLAKAVYLEQGDQKIALVFCDLIGVPQTLTDQVRAEAVARFGIPGTNVLVAATHSHTGPLYFDALRNYFHQRAEAQHGKDPAETVDYPKFLSAKILEAIAESKQGAAPIELDAGRTFKWGLSFNRRFYMKDGAVVFNPGKLNTNIVRSAGLTDPEVMLLRFRLAGAKNPLAIMTSFALHLDTTGGTEYSADYPFYLERTIQKALGEKVVSIFATGTCGDINHIDVASGRPQKGGEEAARIGGALGNAVLQALPQLASISQPMLASRYEQVRTPLQEFSPEQITRARALLEKVGTSSLSFLGQVEAYKINDVEELRRRSGSMLPMDVQVFRLDRNTALVCLPGEVFVDIGLAIKRASPFRETFVIELCNDDIGYVPTRRAFQEGSYETVNSRIQPGGGEKLVESAVKLLKELHGP